MVCDIIAGEVKRGSYEISSRFTVRQFYSECCFYDGRKLVRKRILNGESGNALYRFPECKTRYIMPLGVNEKINLRKKK